MMVLLTFLLFLCIGVVTDMGVWQWRCNKYRKNAYNMLCDLKQRASNRPLELEEEHEKLVGLVLSATGHLDTEEATYLWKRLEAHKNSIDRLLVQVHRISEETRDMNPKSSSARILQIREIYQGLLDTGEDNAAMGEEIAYEARAIEYFRDEIESVRKELSLLERAHRDIPSAVFNAVLQFMRQAVHAHEEEKKPLTAARLLLQAHKGCKDVRITIETIIAQRQRAQSLIGDARRELAGVRAYMDARPADVMQKFGGMYNDAAQCVYEAEKASDPDIHIKRSEMAIAIIAEIRKQGRTAIRRYNQEKEPFPDNRIPHV